MNVLVYLDNCCFNRPYDDSQQIEVSLEAEAKIHIQKAILDRKIDLVWSYILSYENSRNPSLEHRKTIALWEKMATVNIVYSQQTHNLAEKINALGVSEMDSLHIACAIEAKSHYFLTTDKKLLRVKMGNISHIGILNPREFVDKLGGIK